MRIVAKRFAGRIDGGRLWPAWPEFDLNFGIERASYLLEKLQ